MTSIRSVCVFCGSRTGRDPAYRSIARQLGDSLAKAGIRLVYGGGSIGLMTIVADAVLAAGGEAVGVIPEFLDRIEVGHKALTRLDVVDSMHTRKAAMFEQSDAFVVLPGGIGTLDETIEIITWRQLGLHDKPILLVNHEGYWATFLALIDHVVAEDFARPSTRDLYAVVDDVRQVLSALTSQAMGATGAAVPAKVL